MTIELVPKATSATSLTIGDDYAKTNTIEFTIKLTGNEAVWLELHIPIGEDGVLRRPEDANDITLSTFGTDPSPGVLDSAGDPNVKLWSLGDYDDGVQVHDSYEVSVKIGDILCRAGEGGSNITVIGRPASSTTAIITSLTIAKAKPKTAPDNPICYLIAEPTFMIGQGDVTLTWEVVGNTSVGLQTPSGKNISTTESRFTDTHSDGGTYTLTVSGKQRQVTVNVLRKGWHPLQPLGTHAFPSVIFDSGGRTVGALYAIFVHGTERTAVLCKSMDGITGWQIVNDAVPDGMELSPGVQLGNRLWLIGGSTVDPECKSNRICFYDLDHTDQGWQDTTVTGADDFERRMGHACVIVNDTTILVMGGCGRHEALNDVWKLESDTTDRNTLHAVRVTKSSAWAPRCMFSAVNFNGMIWVCGGVTAPNGTPLGDLWASPSSPLSWKERPKDTLGSVGANAIGTGAAFCDDTLFMVVTKQTGGPARTLKKGMWTISKNDIRNTSDTWEKGSLAPELSIDWTSNPHSIALVGFNGRLYLRYLHRNAMYGRVVGAPLFVYVRAT